MQWKPIATSNKVTDFILLYEAYSSKQYVARRITVADEISHMQIHEDSDPNFIRGNWISPSGTIIDPVGYSFMFTHWMPLPKDPEPVKLEDPISLLAELKDSDNISEEAKQKLNERITNCIQGYRKGT